MLKAAKFRMSNQRVFRSFLQHFETARQKKGNTHKSWPSIRIEDLYLPLLLVTQLGCHLDWHSKLLLLVQDSGHDLKQIVNLFDVDYPFSATNTESDLTTK